MKTGTIIKVTSKPRGFILRVPPPEPQTEPPTLGEEIVYLCDADDMAVALAALTTGRTVDVAGTAPSCAGATIRA